jgi:RNA polymerase sigma-70 factor, ECF subfamily
MAEAENRERLTALWLAHQPTVAAYVRRRLPPADVDDAISETFMVAWRRVDEIPRHERPWLLTIARNVIGTRARTDLRWRMLQSRAHADAQVRPPVSADDVATDRMHLLVAWERLSETEREVLALVAWDDLPGREAATILGISRSAYSVRLSRARRHLAALLQEPANNPALVPVKPNDQTQITDSRTPVAVMEESR